MMRARGNAPWQGAEFSFAELQTARLHGAVRHLIYIEEK